MRVVASPSSVGGSSVDSDDRDLPSPKQVNLMMAGAQGFKRALTMRDREKKAKASLPKPKAVPQGSNRARPGTPTKPLPVSPRSVKRERQSLYPTAVGKEGQKGHGKGS